MTKQEKIHSEWSKLGITLLINEYDFDGWINVNELEKYQITSELEFKEITIDIDSDGKRILCRPKSLKGIENNNGWIKIENKDDLPKEIGFYDACCFYENHKEDSSMFYGLCLNDLINYFDEGIITHYQPVIKRDYPIY